MTVAQLVAGTADDLTASERRVADVVLTAPQSVAFGTVATVAEQAGTSGPTVVRFAAKLGFAGFAELQARAQGVGDLGLHPATARIRERPPTDVLGRVLATDVENVRETLEGIDTTAFADAVAVLADRRRRVFVLAGEIGRGAGVAFTTQLDLLRDGVTMLDGSPVRVARRLAEVRADDVVVVIEHRRYERWLLEVLERVRRAGACVIALTDSALSPVAEDARQVFVVAARGVGPFDSQTAALALVHALAAGVAARSRALATQRLDAIEQAWAETNELVDR